MTPTPTTDARGTIRNALENNLIFIVRNILIDACGENKVIQYFDNDEIIRLHLNLIPDVQKMALNTYWRIQFGTIPENTMTERSLLRDNMEVNEWLTMFKSTIMASIIKYGLPKPIVLKPDNVYKQLPLN